MRGFGSGLGHGSQQRSIEELVKQHQGVKRHDEPPRRGCGCTTLVLVVLTVAPLALAKLA